MPDFGMSLISRFIQHRDKNRIFRTWLRDKHRFPFFTSFVEGMAFSSWYAGAEQNKPIDPNSQIDIQLLCCLNRSDVLVSNDARFMKDAFDELWKPKGKRFLTTEQFIQYLERMAA